MDVMKCFIERGADVNVQSEIGWTPLIHASVMGFEKKVNLLLSSDSINLDVQDARGWTALMWATDKGAMLKLGNASTHYEDIVDALIQKGADLDLQNHQGTTALMWAADCGHLNITRSLVAAGANVHLKDSVGQTALSVSLTMATKLQEKKGI